MGAQAQNTNHAALKITITLAMARLLFIVPFMR